MVLRQVGDHRGRVLGPRQAWLRALPGRPGLHRCSRSRWRCARDVVGSRRSTSSRHRRCGRDRGHGARRRRRLRGRGARYRRGSGVLLGAPMAGTARSWAAGVLHQRDSALSRTELTVTLVLPEIIVKHRFHQPLHNGTARRLRRAVRRQPGVVITTVPFHLSSVTSRGGIGRTVPLATSSACAGALSLVRELVAAFGLGELARLGHLGQHRADGAGADAGRLAISEAVIGPSLSASSTLALF